MGTKHYKWDGFIEPWGNVDVDISIKLGRDYKPYPPLKPEYVMNELPDGSVEHMIVIRTAVLPPDAITVDEIAG